MKKITIKEAAGMLLTASTKDKNILKMLDVSQDNYLIVTDYIDFEQYIIKDICENNKKRNRLLRSVLDVFEDEQQRIKKLVMMEKE